jgi:hypothetical protein
MAQPRAIFLSTRQFELAGPKGNNKEIWKEENRGSVSCLRNTKETSFIKTTYDISLDSQISLLPLGFSLLGSNSMSDTALKRQ